MRIQLYAGNSANAKVPQGENLWPLQTISREANLLKFLEKIKTPVWDGGWDHVKNSEKKFFDGIAAFCKLRSYSAPNPCSQIPDTYLDTELDM